MEIIGSFRSLVTSNAPKSTRLPLPAAAPNHWASPARKPPAPSRAPAVEPKAPHRSCSLLLHVEAMSHRDLVHLNGKIPKKKLFQVQQKSLDLVFLPISQPNIYDKIAPFACAMRLNSWAASISSRLWPNFVTPSSVKSDSPKVNRTLPLMA